MKARLPILFSAPVIFIAGAFATWRAVTVNLGLNDMLVAIAEADARGVQMATIGHLVTGIMAGGHPMIVPMWAVYSVGIAGIVLMWLSAACFTLAVRNQPIKSLWTKRYWTTMQWALAYKESSRGKAARSGPPAPRRIKKAG